MSVLAIGSICLAVELFEVDEITYIGRLRIGKAKRYEHKKEINHIFLLSTVNYSKKLSMPKF